MDNHPTHIKYYIPWDSAPIDISFVFEKEKPAGKHGFLKTEGKKFVFEDGTPVRFWGSNFNSGACFPPKDHAPKIARRLSMMGLNIVRFHQMDSEWSRPSLFQFDKGQNIPNTQTLDPRSLDLLDHFIYCLKQEGVYIYLDLLTYRRFRKGDGVENAINLKDGAKAVCLYNRRLIELQKKFNHDLLTHYNPYTKLEYRNDPCIVLSELTNETSFYLDPPVIEPYRHELCEHYRTWAAEAMLQEKSDEEIDFLEPDKDMHSFFIEMIRRYNSEMTAHLRELGVKYPITGTNQSHSMAVIEGHEECDFMDNHEYIWLGTQLKITNKNPLAIDRSFGTMLSMAALPDKPLFISEWDCCWPNEYRAGATLHLAGIMSLQDWAGATIHTYRYGNNVETWLTQRMGRDLVMNNSYGRGGWENYNDPAKFGLFYHAALLVRRGDMQPAKEEIAIKANYPEDTPSTSTALNAAPELHRVNIQLPGRESSADHTAEIHDDLFTGDDIISDTGEMFRNKKTGNGWIDTPMTKAIYGMRCRNDEVSLKGLKVKASNDFYTFAISSLDDKPISDSSNLLITAVGRADNKGARYNGDHTQQIDAGEGPMMIEVIQADIALDTSLESARILAMNYDGFLAGTSVVDIKDGKMQFSIGDCWQNSSMYYLIQSD
jgi:hypothetical protein